MKRDFLSIRDLKREEIEFLLEKALEMKQEGKYYQKSLTGYTLGLIFEKASTRTRVSFESAMFRLGGQTLFLSSRDTQLSRGEPVTALPSGRIPRDWWRRWPNGPTSR